MTTANQNKSIGLKKTYLNDEEYFRAITNVINHMMNGKTNNIGDMAVLNGTTTTTITALNIGNDSYVNIVPLNANSADISTFYLSSIVAGESFTFTHNNSGNARSYRYVIIG